MSIQLLSSLLNGTCSNTHDGTVSATATSVTAADTMGNEAEETSKCRRQSKEQQTTRKKGQKVVSI